MALFRISLENFRNHRATVLDDTRRFNLLVGENGAGKTNVLEALSLLAPGRGLRRATLGDMAMSGTGGGFAMGASLAASPIGDCLDEIEPVRLGTGVDPAHPNRRIVRINGAQSSAVRLGEWLSLAWLTPAMDRLFMDSAGARRRFLDRLALAIDPAHAGHAARYESAMRERNRLLSADDPPDPAWMDALEGQLSSSGARLASGRAALVAALGSVLARLPEEPFARPALSLETNAPAGEQALAEALRRYRGRDRAAGRGLIGPHRDDLSVTLERSGMAADQCSTGEQKALLIAIMLAHADLAAQGRPGVLLLDEVAAHLDPLRRAALFERLRQSGAQVWLTGTEPAPFDAIIGEAAVWRVSGGTLERVN